VYSLAELIDLTEEHDSETRVPCELARAKLAIWSVAQSS